MGLPRFILFIIFLLGLLSWTEAQTPLQTIRGTVIDMDNEQPLVGATIKLVDQEKGTISDSLGTFRFESIPVGRYQLEISYIGYETMVIPELLLSSGKETVVEVKIKELVSDLQTVTVRAVNGNSRPLMPISQYNITVEETRRFPATYFDPARLASNFAGIINDNDQANGLVIRGNSPQGILWRLEGVDIVNPNHLSGAGTFSDRPSANAGGVNILSAQMLGVTNIYTSAFPTGYGNGVSGVLDMRFRPGNNEQKEFTFQAGVIGFDLATEGYFSKDKPASYVLNYRYSFVGLLTSLGADFGGEAINFQDIAVNINLPTQKAGRFTLFGMSGESKNDFTSSRDSSEWAFEKDRQDIVAESEMLAIGMTHTLAVGQNSVWRTSMAFSRVKSSREARLQDSTSTLLLLSRDFLRQRKFSIHSNWTYKLSKRMCLKGGVVATRDNNRNFAFDFNLPNSELIDGQGTSWLLQPYFNTNIQLADQLSFDGGMQYVYYTFNERSTIEPRAALQWRMAEAHTLSLAYGLHSQLQPVPLYFEVDDSDIAINRNLDFTRAHHIVAAYQYHWNRLNRLRVEAYYQRLFDVPVSRFEQDDFSALNFVEFYRPVVTALANTGKGQNYGFEVSWQKYFGAQTYYLLNGNLYNSTYEGSDGVERNTRFNGNYAFNATVGKEWQWNKKGRERILGINIRGSYLGGFRTTPIDEATSAAAGFTVYRSEEIFELRQRDYRRIDFRIYYKNNKKKFGSTLSLDIQNIANFENIAYEYYDQFQNQIVTQNQLGLIPILNYRVTF